MVGKPELATTNEMPKKKRKAQGPRGPRYLTVLATVDNGAIVVHTASTNAADVLRTFAQLTKQGVQPQLIDIELRVSQRKQAPDAA